MTKLAETSESSMAITFLVMNLSTLLRQVKCLFLSLFLHIYKLGFIEPFLIKNTYITANLSREKLIFQFFSYLASELKSGDVCVQGSSEYADWRKQLLSWDECEKLVEKYCEDLELPKDADSLVSSLKSWLTDTAAKVDSSYPQNEQLIINDDGEPVLKKLPVTAHRNKDSLLTRVRQN